MLVPGMFLGLRRLAGPLPVWHAGVGADDWLAAARAVREGGGRLVALWG